MRKRSTRTRMRRVSASSLELYMHPLVPHACVLRSLHVRVLVELALNYVVLVLRCSTLYPLRALLLSWRLVT